MTPAPDPTITAAAVSAAAAGRGTPGPPPTCCGPPLRDLDRNSDLFTRTSWVDAALALSQIDKRKASGRRTALRVRSKAQSQLFQLGCFVQRHAGKVLFVAALVLTSFCVGLKSVHVQTKVDRLWVEAGGRLERELRYTRAALGEDSSGTTHQLLIQTPRNTDASVLQPAALLAHLDVVRAASAVSVHMFDITWRLKDICYSPSFPTFDVHYIDQILENIFPCAIVTPLDCFWEGSKLLGPQLPVTIPGIGSGVRWTNLDPLKLLKQMKNFDLVFDFDTLEEFMKRAGISSAYQEKPCLNPADPECPVTAPNKHNGLVPDIGAELTGGCYGFAARFMHWPEELVVGGAKRNRTGHIVRARALQTVIQLMGARDMFEFWQSTYKVHHIEWSADKAAAVIDAWQQRFTQELERVVRGEAVRLSPEDEDDDMTPQTNVALNRSAAARLANFRVVTFSSASLDSLLAQFSELNIPKLAIGYLLMLVYAAFALARLEDVVRSQSGVGLAGVALVGLTVAAGLGLCALLGLPFNASTTQIVPFLALGLGMDDLFLLTNAYAEQAAKEGRSKEQTGEILKRAGISVLLGCLSKMGAFFAAVIIPIPALRILSLQAAVLLLFHMATMLLVFPAILSLDLRRRRAGRADIACCLTPPSQRSKRVQISPSQPDLTRTCKRQAIARALPPDRHTFTTVLAPVPPPSAASRNVERWAGSALSLSAAKPESVEEGWPSPICAKRYSLRRFAYHQYGGFITKPAFKGIAMCILCLVLVASSFGITKMRDGLDLTDLVPSGTSEHDFLRSQNQYFGFYSMFAVTKGGFEYPSGQRLLHEYHSSFLRVNNILRNDDGGLPPFWLSLFRDWLKGLQAAFDRDWQEGRITAERWFTNASDDGVLAYKLLVQTGRVDHPIDKSLLTRARLVDESGIINPRAFYNYLSAWTTNDALAYSASQANLRPEPKRWYHSPTDYELKIPKSQPLHYAQMPFYLHGLMDTDAMTAMINQVREVCAKFEERGLPNYPIGIPFMFWEQYLGLRSGLGLALAAALGAIAFAVLLILFNPWAAVLIVLTLASCALQSLGLLGLLGIPLSAITAVLTIIGVGIAAQPCLHICLSFVTAIGNRDKRVCLALEHMLAPVAHGAATTLLGVAMLAFSRFDFIVRYFFLALLGVQVVTLINGLLFFPVLLSIFGPSAEVVPHDHEERISTPTPSPPRRRRPPAPVIRPTKKPSSTTSSGVAQATTRCSHHCREASLTTISEEPNSWQSGAHEVVVQPELVVETTTHHYHHPHPPPASGQATGSCPEGCPAAAPGCRNIPTPTSCSQGATTNTTPQPSHVTTTRVTATAKLKVEVHTPSLPGTVSTSSSTSSSAASTSAEDSGDSAGRLS